VPVRLDIWHYPGECWALRFRIEIELRTGTTVPPWLFREVLDRLGQCDDLGGFLRSSGMSPMKVLPLFEHPAADLSVDDSAQLCEDRKATWSNSVTADVA
jgi:hypothetical protein